MRATYEVRAWREGAWWMAEVIGASEGADRAPLNAVSHARTLTSIEQTSRDLVATILDVDETAFDLDLEYVLPTDVDTVVCEAIGARMWLDAAQELWHEHSTIVVRTLLGHGFSLRETAKLLGLSEQWADQRPERDISRW
jgi:hypothetical protein